MTIPHGTAPPTSRTQTLANGTDLTLTHLPGGSYWLSATKAGMTFALSLDADELMQLRTDAAVLLAGREI